MTPTALVALAAFVALVAIIFAVRRFRHPQNRTADLGVVSTRWISELRRDEPWTRS